MSRRVFISFLGTGNYNETVYQFSSGIKAEPTRFIQEAIASTECRSWTKEDRIFIFYTNQSHLKNWKNSIDKETQEHKTGLEERLSLLNLEVPIQSVEICDGSDEKEIWDIFSTVYDVLEDGDRIYADITHAFRSIPIFCTTLFNFARFMKNVVVESIQYGAFEKRNQDIPESERTSPVIDLTALVRLQQYTEIASGLDAFGRVNTTEINRVITDSEDKEYGNAIDKFCNSLIEFDNNISSNRLVQIQSGKCFKNLDISSRELIKGDFYLPNPLLKVIEKISETLDGFSIDGNGNLNVESAIEWAEKYHMLPLAYTFAREYLASRMATYFSHYKPSSMKTYKYKEFFSGLICVEQRQINSGSLTGDLGRNPLLVNTLIKVPMIAELRKDGSYNVIAEYRNKVNHGLDATYDELRLKFHENYINCLSIINKYSNDKISATSSSSSHKKVFLNISNHPSSEWSENQIQKASKFGNIVDVQFPSIPTSVPETYIEKHANDLVKKICKDYSNCEIVAHVMGEMTFTYSLVRKLKAQGIRCVASTTERVVETLEDGRKASTFQFVMFRNY